MQSCLPCRFYLGNRMQIGSDSREWGDHDWANNSFSYGRRVNTPTLARWCFLGKGWGSRSGAAGGGGHHRALGNPSCQEHRRMDRGRWEGGRGWAGGFRGLVWTWDGTPRGQPDGAHWRSARRPYLPIIVECCCTAASSSLSKMVHSPIAVHPEAADKDWAAPGTFPLLAPPRAAPPDWEQIAPRLKKQTNFLKIHESPLPFIILKRGKWGKKSKQTPTDGAAGAVRRAGTNLPRRPGLRSGACGCPGEGQGGGGSVLVRELSPAWERSLDAAHPGDWGSGRVRARARLLALQWAPGASALPPARPGRSARSWLLGSGIRATASNPPLSSLRLRHARSAAGSRARRAAVAARRGPRGRGRARRGEGGKSPGGPAGSGATWRERIAAPHPLLRAPR